MSVPIAIRRIVTQASAKDPEKRFQSCDEFIRALQESTRTQPSADNDKRSNRTSTTTRKSHYIAILALLIIFALITRGFVLHKSKPAKTNQGDQSPPEIVIEPVLSKESASKKALESNKPNQIFKERNLNEEVSTTPVSPRSEPQTEKKASTESQSGEPARKLEAIAPSGYQGALRDASSTSTDTAKIKQLSNENSAEVDSKEPVTVNEKNIDIFSAPETDF